MIRHTLKSTPSYSDVLTCPSCKFSKKNTFSHVTVACDIYKDDMKHLEEGIKANLPKSLTCECGEEFNLIREPGAHLFVEVNFWFDNFGKLNRHKIL